MSAYDRLLRPLLFRLPADRGHDLAQRAMRMPVGWSALGRGGRVADPRLGVTLAGIPVANPVGLAPGLDKDGRLLRTLRHLGFGYLVVGSATPLPRAGNARPRLVRYPDRGSLANAMGLPNRGVPALARALRDRPPGGPPVIASISAFSTVDTLAAAAVVAPYADAVEIGLVCPNTSESVRMRELEAVTQLVRGLAAGRTGPVFLKLPPFHDEVERDWVLAMVDACVRYGIDGVSLSGGRPVSEAGLSTGRGSLSGRDTFPDALRIVAAVAGHARGRLCVRASGGVFTGEHAAALLRAGAHAVEVYSSVIYRGPAVAGAINRDLLSILDRDQVGSVAELSPAG